MNCDASPAQPMKTKLALKARTSCAVSSLHAQPVVFQQQHRLGADVGGVSPVLMQMWSCAVRSVRLSEVSSFVALGSADRFGRFRFAAVAPRAMQRRREGRYHYSKL